MAADIARLEHLSPDAAATIRELRQLIDPRTAGPIVGEPWQEVVLRAARRAHVDGTLPDVTRREERIRDFERELAAERDRRLLDADGCCG